MSISVLFSILVVVVSASLLIVLVLYLMDAKEKLNMERKKKVAMKSKTVINEEPGRLFVPDETYDMLKKEGRIHPKDDDV